jgi:hypothetical protein
MGTDRTSKTVLTVVSLILIFAGLLETAHSQDTASIREFYNEFKRAYESRNDTAVCSLISKDWQSADGSSISSLQANLRRTFRMFDEVRYDIQNMNMNMNRQPDGAYRVSYDVTIIGKIYKRNLKHEEKSSVNEEVIIDGSGRVKISRTLGGRIWYTR